MIDPLQASQNPDGGWPYRHGASSWIEPTVYSLLAGYACGDSTGRSRALDWIRSKQRSDGGWAPQPGLPQSTWVTSLVALLPAEDLGIPEHMRSIRWLLSQTPANATYLFRFRNWLQGIGHAEAHAGFSWVSGTAGWATPTALAILALAKQNRRRPDSELKNRIASARAFLLEHRCRDGGWNHGSAQSLGVDAVSYPETTGTALLAIAGTQPNGEAVNLAPSVARAESWWTDCPSCEAANWLALGLRAAGKPKEAFGKSFKPRTIPEVALRLIAGAGNRGTEIFLG
jgi:hypothetical protein